LSGGGYCCESGMRLVTQTGGQKKGSYPHSSVMPWGGIRRRHANVSTTATYYIKTVAEDVRNAMVKLESNITQTQSDTHGTLNLQTCPIPRSVN